MTEKVIVAVDGGEASDAALEWVIERSKRMLLDLEITAVVDTGSIPTGSIANYRSMYETTLRKAASRVTEASSRVEATQVVRQGAPAKALIAASAKADLLVIGTNKTGRLAGITHGTLPLRIAGRSRCATVVVPVGWHPQGSGVVVGWDDNDTGDLALDFAANEAQLRGSPLTIVHSWPVPPAMGVDPASSAILFQDMIDTHRTALSLAAERIHDAHPGLEIREQFEPSPASPAIVRAAEGAALVVVGTHGRGALGGLILGSVSHGVLMNMPAPVAVVPYPEEPITVLPEILEEDLI